MGSTPSPSLAELHAQIVAVEALQRGSYVAVAALFLVYYDFLITFGQEVKYFWSGRWTVTRCLWFLVRYLPLIELALGLYCWFGKDLSLSTCEASVKATCIFSLLIMLIIQAILTVRVWYLFAQSTMVRSISLTVFVGGAASTMILGSLSFVKLQAVPPSSPGLLGCEIPTPPGLWRVFVPSFIVHTVMCFFTTYRAFQLSKKRSFKGSLFIHRLSRDGGLFFVLVIVAIAISLIGAALTDAPNFTVPVVFSSFIVSTTAICFQRVMLSIRSLASELSNVPVWIINPAELTRVWRPGQDGTVIVEVDHSPPDDVAVELDQLDHGRDMLSGHTLSSYQGSGGTDKDKIMVLDGTHV